MQPTVYLAGPITGLDFDGCTAWRDYVKRELQAAAILAYSPMRAKEYLRGRGELPALKNAKEDYEYAKFGALSTSKAIITRDRWDATHRDLMLCNLVGAKTVSIGTVMEIAWADLYRIPIVLAMEEGNIHEHGMLNEAAGAFRVATIEEAVQVTKAILLPDAPVALRAAA